MAAQAALIVPSTLPLHIHVPIPTGASTPEQGSGKLRVVITANGTKEVAQALALVVRLSRCSNIETRAIIDEDSWPAHRLSQEAITILNRTYTPRETDEARKGVERSQNAFLRRQAGELSEWADLLVLAPVDANTIAKMLQGLTDCVVLDIIRSWDVSKKILLVPGMAVPMWENPMTKRQLGKIRRKWQWVRVMQPILWRYDIDDSTQLRSCTVAWDGFDELVDVIRNQAELMSIGHDVEIARTNPSNTLKHSVRTDAVLPTEIWSVIFEYVGDWELAQALGVYANIRRPAEWIYVPSSAHSEVQRYIRQLEWTLLTCPTKTITDTLSTAPQNLHYFSGLCVKLILKFCLTGVLSYLEAHHEDLFRASFGQTMLPIKASAVFGRTEILEWWRTSPTFLSKDYTVEAIDGASRLGFVHVLEWWRRSGLPLKYSDAALEQASSQGHIHILEWWKHASSDGDTPMAYQHQDRGAYRKLSITLETRAMVPVIHQTSLQLKPGRSLLGAAQNNQSAVLRWWEDSGLMAAHGESVAKIASTYGHVSILDTWRALKSDKMVFDSDVLVGPTKNGHLNVLQWWKDYSGGEGNDSGKTRRVEYKTCDIEEALEDFVGKASLEFDVRRWWARNGLNLSVGVSEWTKTMLL